MQHTRKILLLSICLFGLAAFAQQNPPSTEGGEHHKHGGQMHHEMPTAEDHLKELTARLNLTADQQAKIKPILDEHLQQMNDLKKDSSLSKEDSHAKMEAIHNDLRDKVRGILTDDQKTKFDAMMKEHEAGGHDHHGKGSDKH